MVELDKLIRGKHINFLIGAGASAGLYPTLQLEEIGATFEEIVSHDAITENAQAFMYIYYFLKWIVPMASKSDYKDDKVFEDYKKLVRFFNDYLQGESNERPKRINVFTTNYDLLFEHVFDNFLYQNPLIYFNDGSRGVFNKYISNSNFYLNVTHSGYNDNYRYEVPTVNLFKLHGSISWKINNDRIMVDQDNSAIKEISGNLEKFNITVDKIEPVIEGDKGKGLAEFISKINCYVESIDSNAIKTFFDSYATLPIINPNKYKFHQTVFEQHYYQLLRSFSYELERKQSVLIVFGFSFADEHLRDIFKRSLLNPELQVIMISYSEDGQKKLKDMFKGYRNITYMPECFCSYKGDFTYFLKILEGRL